MRRLLLVRHAPTPATRGSVFPTDESLDARGTDAAAALGRLLRDEVLASPARRCRETIAAAGRTESPLVDPRLAECDFGAWAGRSFEAVFADDPEGARSWLEDPGAAPHGGETQTAFSARVAGWLDEQATLDGRAVAVTHGGVVKAAVVHALDAPAAAFWRVDVAPLSVTELHAHDGRWTLTRLNCPLEKA